MKRNQKKRKQKRKQIQTRLSGEARQTRLRRSFPENYASLSFEQKQQELKRHDLNPQYRSWLQAQVDNQSPNPGIKPAKDLTAAEHAALTQAQYKDPVKNIDYEFGDQQRTPAKKKPGGPTKTEMSQAKARTQIAQPKPGVKVEAVSELKKAQKKIGAGGLYEHHDEIYELFGNDGATVYYPQDDIRVKATDAQIKMLDQYTGGAHRYKFELGKKTGWLDGNKAFLNMKRTIKNKSFNNKLMGVNLDIETTGTGVHDEIIQFSLSVDALDVETKGHIQTMFNFDALVDPRHVNSVFEDMPDETVVSKGAYDTHNIPYSSIKGKKLNKEQLRQLVYIFENADAVIGHNIQGFDSCRLFRFFDRASRSQHFDNETQALYGKIADAIQRNDLRHVDTAWNVNYEGHMPADTVVSRQQGDLLMNGWTPEGTNNPRIRTVGSHTSPVDTVGVRVIGQKVIRIDNGNEVLVLGDAWDNTKPGFPSAQTEAERKKVALERQIASRTEKDASMALHKGDDAGYKPLSKRIKWATATAEDIVREIDLARLDRAMANTTEAVKPRFGLIGLGVGLLTGYGIYRAMEKSPAEETLDRWSGQPRSSLTDVAILGGLGAASWNAHRIVPGFPNLAESLGHITGGKSKSFTSKIVRFGSLGLLAYSAIATTHNIMSDQGRPGERMRHPALAGAVGMLGASVYGAYGSAGYDADLMFARAFTGVRDRLVPWTKNFGEMYSEAAESTAQKVKKGVVTGGGYFAETFNDLVRNTAKSKFAKGCVIGGIAIGIAAYTASGGQNNKVIPPTRIPPSGQTDMMPYNRQMSAAVASYKPSHIYRHPYRQSERSQARPHGLALV